MLTLKGTQRDVKKNNDSLREEGVVPAVLYGKSTDALSVSIGYSDFLKVWNEAGESTIISLDIEGKTHDALIHEVQVHPVSGDPIHIDFYIVEAGQTVTVEVPVEFVGEAPGVENEGGVLVKVIHEIEIESEPRNLPSEIEIDISVLAHIGDSIAIKDITFPEGVEPTNDPEDTVVLVSEAREEEEEEETEALNLDAIEISEERGKEAEGEGEGDTKQQEKEGDSE